MPQPISNAVPITVKYAQQRRDVQDKMCIRDRTQTKVNKMLLYLNCVTDRKNVMNYFSDIEVYNLWRSSR